MESPLVALLASPGADSRVTSRGFASIAHLLAPFTTHTVNIRDPSNAQYVSSKVSLDVRDIRKQGHLLSLSVLPYVLQEALVSGANLDASLSSFSESIRRWAEPSDQETLRSYLSCLFVVAGGEEQPLSELSRLIQTQHTQQHATTESKSIGPSHCAPPKWTTPNTLKHYILMHDSARDDDAKSTEVFNQMCATYGVDSCQMLRIGVGSSDGLKDPWLSGEEVDRLLDRGLERARQHATAATVKHSLDKRDSLATSVATISPSYAMVQSPSISSPSSSINGHTPTLQSPASQRLASSADREACGKVVEKYLKDALVPHAERLIRTLNDQLADRRGIGKSLTSGMKKWFGSTATQNNSAAPPTYGSESAEMKSRRLADLAFQFGLYSFAHSQYRSVKKDFENEQAWLHHAAALEMSAVALQLSGQGIPAKQFPVHYLTEALKLQLSNAGSHSSVIQCALNVDRIFTDLGMQKEAGVQLSTVAGLDSDQYVGVAQAHAANRFSEAGQLRKAAFYRVLAGNRFIKGNIRTVAIECYRLALPAYFEKHWDSIEDHLCALLSAELSDPRLAGDCAARLLRANSWQTPAKQTEHVDNFVRTLARFGQGTPSLPAVLPLPLLDAQSTRVICGERPLSDDVPIEEDIEWGGLERAAFHCLAGTSSGFRPTHLVADSSTDNMRIRETPPDERFRVRIAVTNPLAAPLTIYNMRLGVTHLHMRNAAPLETAFSAVEVLTLTLEPEQTTDVELWLRPSSDVKEFRVDAILMELADSQGNLIHGRIPVHVKGKRLNKTQHQMKSIIHADDVRLSAHVATHRWPLLDFRVHRSSSQTVYCSQAVKMTIEVQNIGHEPVNGLSIATNGVDCVDVLAEDDVAQIIPCTSSIGVNSTDTRVFNIACQIPVGGKLTISINVRAPSEATVNSVALLFFYRGVSGAYREWRSTVSMPTTALLSATARVLDSTHGLVLLQLTNRIASSLAALARIDVLRIRTVRQLVTSSGDWQTVDPNLALAPVRNRAVQLEDGQSDNICFTLVGDATSSASSEVWLSDPVSAPSWPLPRPPLTEEDIRENRQLAVLWKASVIDNDGHVTSLMGEEFIPCPFAVIDMVIPGLQPSIPLSRSPSRGAPEEKENQTPAITVKCPPIHPVQHNFKLDRMCELPFKVSVSNGDTAKRLASVTVRFIPKVRDAVPSIQLVPPDCRQLWWPDRSVAKALIEAGDEHTFFFKIRVGQPSVYELGGAQMNVEVQLDDETPVTLKVPGALVVVNAI